ncbi:hypothetical protein [Nocardia concava]|uniref:hypothetical protein n=1 Tax=Nocardia concava TaxID=257281 RepID=UPI0012FC1F51|nr:hypothetical protein [Nocardia concava]
MIAGFASPMWYHPRWFDRYVPDLDIEGVELEQRFARDAEPEAPQPVAESS